MSKFRKQAPPEAQGPKRPPPLDFTVSILCMEAPPAHLEWQGKQWVRMDPTPWGLIGHNAGNQAWCERAAHWIAQQVQKAEGGVWVGVVRDCSNDPVPDRPLDKETMLALRKHILNGPNGPGRGFLSGNPKAPLIPTLKTAARVPPPVRVATKAMVDRLQQPVSLDGNPVKADDEFWTDTSDLREPGEEG